MILRTASPLPDSGPSSVHGARYDFFQIGPNNFPYQSGQLCLWPIIHGRSLAQIIWNRKG